MKNLNKKLDNRGVSLMELIVVVGIMAVLMCIISPMMVRYIGKARQVKVEKEASEFLAAARLAYVEVHIDQNVPSTDAIKNKTVTSSPYYRNGTKYGNLTNWTVHNGVVAGASNGPFADAFFSTLGITYGKEWKNGKSTIPISESQPKMNPAGSMTEKCIFQVFYNENGDMVVEYSRYGYFVRMDNSVLVDSIKIKNEQEKYFTVWK